MKLKVLSIFSVFDICVEESHLSYLLEIWELPGEKDIELLHICSLEKQQKRAVNPDFIDCY